MPDQIRTISNKDHFNKIFTAYFQHNPVFIKTKSGNISVQYLGYSEGNVAFRLSQLKNVPDTIIAFTRHKGHTIYATLKLNEKNEDTFIFFPEKMQILSEWRKEDRMLTDVDSGGTRVIYIQNVISDFIIKNALEIHKKKVDHIEEIATFDLKKRFANVKIFFISQGKRDVRMNYILENKCKSICVCDLNSEPEDDKTKTEYNSYINEIYTKDPRMSRNSNFIAEVTIPILYRQIIPYGYVQINHLTPLSEGHVNVVKRMSVVINELMRKNNIIPGIEDKFVVSDLSTGGLGIVFKNRRQTTYFRKDSLITFEMLLPTQKKALIGAAVRNINYLENGIIKVGCQILHMDQTSKENYNEFCETLGN